MRSEFLSSNWDFKCPKDWIIRPKESAIMPQTHENALLNKKSQECCGKRLMNDEDIEDE